MISWKNYFNRYTSLFTEYDLTRKAISGFQDTPGAAKKYAKDEVENIKKDLFEHAKKAELDLNNSWISNDKKIQSFIKFYLNSLPDRLGEVKNRINQNELIMRVTLFEVFMKDVHREILKQKPSLLSPDKKIPLGKLISLGQEEVINEEAERKIHSLDRESLAKKADYFKNDLSVDWTFDGKILPILEHAIDLRNTILHVDPNIEIDEESCFSATIIGLFIPVVTVAQCSLLYPGGFEEPDNFSNLLEHCKKQLNLEK